MRRITPSDIDDFLDILAASGSVTEAAHFTDISPARWYRLRRTNESFKRDWLRSADLGTAALEDEALRRAHKGVLEPIYYKGKRVGFQRRFSDVLLMFMLKARKPQIYRENVTLSGDPNNPIVSEQSIMEGARRLLFAASRLQLKLPTTTPTPTIDVTPD